ncbi:MAG: discoidin domain-containing protein [Patescibacteria group bacterium]|nr:discoidin domain-containing protein [Patescibacteria group bacterium]
MRGPIALTLVLLGATSPCNLVVAQSERPQVQTHCGDVPIKRFGYCWVLGEGPDLLDDVSFQVGNEAPRVKVRPKESGQIGRNYLGVTTTRMPRSPENDYLPLEAIHLIDGNLQTCWMSHGQSRGDAQQVWIRIDLPVERTIERVVLRKRPLAEHPRSTIGWTPTRGAMEVGRGVPATLAIKVSRDSREWTTVFDGPSGDTPEKLDCDVSFAPLPAKQIWILAGNLPLVENVLYAFSLAELEVYDTAGRNVALATRGSGVTVNSSHHGAGMDLASHRWYWPLHYDAGFKWARVGYHDDPINWHWVEKEKGVLKIDPVTDAALTELVSNGVDVVMSLGFGNRLYSGPAERTVPQLWEWNYDMPAPPTTPEALAAWTRYVEFMVKHFRDRVKHFEIWNEWNISCYWGAEPKVEHFLAVARAAIPVIRKHAPDAKIMMGSWAGFPHGISEWSPAELESREKSLNYLAATRELAAEVDEIGWHPFYQKDPERLQHYAADVRALQQWLRGIGFRGHCMATEWNYSALYPPLTETEAELAWCGGFRATEIEKAKYVAQVFTRHTALGVESFFCEMYYPYFSMLDLSLLRRSFDADPISPLQPQAAYYVTRNLATMLDGLEPGEWEFEIVSGPPQLEAFALQSADGPALVLWLGGHAKDHCEGVAVDVRLKATCREAVGSDPMNGVAQTLKVVADDAGGAVLKGIIVRDWPLVIRLRDGQTQ